MATYDPDFVDDRRVGRIYHVAINGQGYMLADSGGPDEQSLYQRGSVPLIPQRLATGDTPFSEAVERYSFAGFSDWRTGRGQKRRSIVDVDLARFHESMGVDPFDGDGLRLVRKPSPVSAIVTGPYTNAAMVVINDVLYYWDGLSMKELTDPSVYAAPGSTVASYSPVGFTDDGEQWYYSSNEENIYRGTTAQSTFATLTGKFVGPLGWGGNRLLVAYGTVPDVYDTFSTVTSAGAEEVADGRISLPTGWTIQAFTAGQGYVFFAANGPGGLNAWRSVVYAWDLTTYTPYVVDEFEGESIVDLSYFQGQMLIRTRRQHQDGASFAIYRAAIEESTGALTKFLVFEGGTDDPQEDYASVALPSFAVSGPLVYFPWPGDSIVALDLETGGAARFWPLLSTQYVAGPITWQGQPTWIDGPVDMYRAADEEYAPVGWLETSLVDGASTLTKIWDAVRLQTEPLPASTGVAVSYSTNSYRTLVAAPDASVAASGTESYAELAFAAKQLGLRLTLATEDGVRTPVVQLAQLQFHASGLADEVLVLPIDCGDSLRGLNGAPIDENGPGNGAARAADLQTLVNSRVQIQDIDWHLTSETDIWEVEQVSLNKRLVFNPHQGEAAVRMVAVMQARRQQDSPVVTADSTDNDSTTVRGLGIETSSVFMSMQLGLGPPLTSGVDITDAEGRQNVYKLSMNWAEGTAADDMHELIIATTPTGSSGAAGYPVYLTRGQNSSTFGIAGVWAIGNRTIRPTNALNYLPIGVPPNLTGTQVGWLRITQTGSTLVGETSADGVTYETWFTETIDPAKHAIVGAAHGIYASAYGIVGTDDDQMVFYSYQHIGPSGTDVLWDATVELAWAELGPGLEWTTNGATTGEFEFPNARATVAFWDGDTGIVTI